MDTPLLPPPTLSGLAGVLGAYSQARADRSLHILREITGPAPDPTEPQHRTAMLAWLNQWGCRIRAPRSTDQQANTFDESLANWWGSYGTDLPNVTIARAKDDDIAAFAEAYADLVNRPCALRTRGERCIWHRKMGPTATAKIMYILRPETATPWDATIARRHIGGTTSRHFTRHLTIARHWVQAMLIEARRTGITDISAEIGRADSSLAKLCDKWLYLTITRRKQIP